MAKKRSGVAATGRTGRTGRRERSGVAGRGLGDEEGARESTMLKRGGRGASVSAGGRPTDALLSAGGTN